MKKLVPLFIFSFFIFLSACSGGSDKNKAESSEAKQTEQSADQASDDIRTIDIIGVDQMKFVVKEEGEMIGTAETVKASGETYLLLNSIDAKAGEEIRVRLKTKSQLPGSAMSHNFVLLNNDSDVSAFASAATKAKDNNYIPADMTDQVVTHTDMAAGGETVETTFTVPEETGEYPYLCSFPAHFAAGMKGTLNVE